MPSSSRARTYWERRLGHEPSLSSVGYQGLSDTYHKWAYRSIGRSLRAAVPTVIDRDILDVGSGTGFWVGYWAGRGARRVDATDIASASVASLTARYPRARVMLNDISLEAPAAQAYDVICAVNVLQHVTEDAAYEAASTNLRASIRTGGLLILVDALTLGPAAPFEGTYSRVRSLIEAKAVLSKTGWMVERVQPATWLLFGVIEREPRWFCATLDLLWAVTQRLVRRDARSRVVGPLLYAVDGLLTRLSWGPSTKILLARAE